MRYLEDDATSPGIASGDGPKAFPAAPKIGERDSTLSMAVQLYVGVGVSSFPTRLPSALEAYFGSERAARLRELVEQLLSEAWLDWQDWGTSDLVQATQRVAERVGDDHPELSPDAVRALAWNFSYQSK
jgi:hypothetical protein